MNLRHEWKHEITYSDMLAIRQRLSAVMTRDSHTVGGKYNVRSMYFDDLRDTALKEKIDGVNRREKFRIRYYNGDLSFIQLEKKSKINGLCSKEQALLSADEARSIASGDISVLLKSENPLCRELYQKMRSNGIYPKTIVDYTREPFIYAPGNVRVTLDYNIRTGLSGKDFLDPECVTVPVRDAPIILEVKWDDFLPSVIRDIVQLPGCRTAAFSKYAACRMYD